MSGPNDKREDPNRQDPRWNQDEQAPYVRDVLTGLLCFCAD
jgi:hypothetical protein